MKYEWRKSEKEWVNKSWELVGASQQFIVTEGEGNPNEADFSEGGYLPFIHWPIP